MEMETGTLNLLVTAIERCLVDSHTVWKASLEEIVIATSGLCNRLGQVHSFSVGEVDKRAKVFNWEDHGLEGPDCPPGADDQKSLVLKDNSLVLFPF